MATKKKTTKKTTKKVVKKTTKKATAKKAAPKKKATRKTTTSSSRRVPNGSYTIRPIGGAASYWRELANAIHSAIGDGYKEINYYDNDFGLRLHVQKDGKVVVETGYNKLFTERAIPEDYTMAEYALNRKKINTIEDAEEINNYEEDDE